MCKKEDIIIIILVILFFIIICCQKKNVKENWIGYKQKPFGHVKTGTNPYNFYALPRYRKPYRYPFQFTKTAPIKHNSYLD